MTPALFRLTIFNICGAAGLIAAWRMGYVEYVMHADAVGMAYVIVALFAAGLTSVYVRIREAGRIRRKLVWGGNGEPHYYVLPYTTAKAQQLQSAMDGAANGEGEGVEGELGEDGEMAFHPKPVTDNGPKEAEQPMTEVE